MRIATWNVNSIRQREPHVLRWLKRAEPDVLFLQETKCEEHAFPTKDFAGLGYRAVMVGQKAYNGVAVLARLPFEVVHTALPGLSGDLAAQARYIEIRVDGLTLIGIYLPNGNSGGDSGYAGKLEWIAALRARAEALLAEDADFAILGDWNVAPTDEDCAKGALSADDALVRPQTRAAYRSLVWLGLTDALRALHPGETLYTFWDYKSACFERDCGLRIDHALLSPKLAERLTSATVERRERGEEQPSDHVPVVVEISP
jgi:exodeoxyribonuclease-3